MIPVPRPRRSDEGSVLPLALAYCLLALAVILVCVNATSVLLAQKRLEALADSAALASVDRFDVMVEDEHSRARVDPAQAENAAAAVIEVARAELGLNEVVLADVVVPDFSSARIVLRDTWHPVLLSAFVPDGVELSATATARVALR